MKKAFIILISAAVLVCTLANTALCCLCLGSNRQLYNAVTGDSELTEETREDDVEIMGSYKIKSTRAISDAYLRGDTAGLSDKEKEILDMASEVLAQVITQETQTDYQKEKAVYDWMLANLSADQGLLTVIPTSGQDADNPYGTLKYHNAVCVGYATTFRLFMQMLNIECMVVHNTECYHSWDLVKLGDNWYHTDIYSDMDSTPYANFNMNDTLCASGHDWDTDFFPAATSMEYNYAAMQAIAPDSVYDIPQKLYDALEAGDSLLALRFGSDFTEADAQLASYIVAAVSERISYTGDYSCDFLESNFCPLDDGWLLVINILNYDEEETEPDEEARLKADDAVDAVFPYDEEEWEWEWEPVVNEGAVG